MRRLLPVTVIAVLAIVLVTAYLQQDLILDKIEQLVTAGTAPAYNEPEPITLFEALDLPAAPADTLEITDMRTLSRRITAGAVTDYQKLEAIYDWVTANFAYDLDKLKNMSAYDSGAAYLLNTGKGICHDYAELTRALLTEVGIEATYESGDVYPAPGITERHAWNHARVDGIWYALDTTWGSGFVVEDEERFIQKPRRLYLTTPEELFRLHRDPAYKEEREQAYRKERTAQANPVTLPEYEREILEQMNKFRAASGLPALSEERRVLEIARQAAARIATLAANDEEYTLVDLSNQLERKAAELRISSAGIYAFMQWDHQPATAAELYNQIVQEQQEYLKDGRYRAASVAVIRKGEVTAVVQIYLSHY